MRTFALVSLVLAATAQAQFLQPMRDGSGHEITLRAREGATIDPLQAVLRPVPLVWNVGRWEDRPAWTGGSGSGFPLGRWWLFPEPRVVIPASEEATLLLDRSPA